MKLIVQPEAGATPIIHAIEAATTSIAMLIFRLDRHEITRALEGAVQRGVSVRVLIAHRNHSGRRNLRHLEMRLLRAGVHVSRTADDLLRYHGKMLIIDERLLHVYGFNGVRRDFYSRSFGIITTNRRFVQEALRLFNADESRRPYTAGLPTFIVSPVNARQRLVAFIRGAQQQLLIYDVQASDPAMLRLLADRARNGVDVRLIGHARHAPPELAWERYPGKRLHVRAIVRDGERAFVGSQSLRSHELDLRREVGIIVHDPRIVQGIQRVFEQDWALTTSGRLAAVKSAKAEKAVKNVMAKVMNAN